MEVEPIPDKRKLLVPVSLAYARSGFVVRTFRDEKEAKAE